MVEDRMRKRMCVCVCVCVCVWLDDYAVQQKLAQHCTTTILNKQDTQGDEKVHNMDWEKEENKPIHYIFVKENTWAYETQVMGRKREREVSIHTHTHTHTYVHAHIQRGCGHGLITKATCVLQKIRQQTWPPGPSLSYIFHSDPRSSQRTFWKRNTLQFHIPLLTRVFP